MDRRGACRSDAPAGTGSDVGSHETRRTPDASALSRGDPVQHPLRSSRVPKSTDFRPSPGLVITSRGSCALDPRACTPLTLVRRCSASPREELLDRVESPVTVL